MTVSSLAADDSRSFSANVAGPAALLIAKAHKISDRVGSTRLLNKDALDVFRLLRGIPTDTLVSGITMLLADDRSAGVSVEALSFLRDLFGSADSEGSRMAGEAVVPIEDPAIIAASCEALSGDLFAALGENMP